MARIAGINIPTNKKVFTGLTYIKGIGPKIASDICKLADIPSERRVNELTDSEVIQIREIIEGNVPSLQKEYLVLFIISVVLIFSIGIIGAVINKKYIKHNKNLD